MALPLCLPNAWPVPWRPVNVELRDLPNIICLLSFRDCRLRTWAPSTRPSSP